MSLFHSLPQVSLKHLNAKAGHAAVKIEPIHPKSGHFGTAMARRQLPFGEFLETLKDPEQRGKYYLTTQYDEEGDDEDGDVQRLGDAEAGALGLKRKRSHSDDGEDARETGNGYVSSEEEDGETFSDASDVSLTPKKEDLDPVLPSPMHALADELPLIPSIMGGLVLQQCNLWMGASPSPTYQTNGLNGKTGQQVEGKSSGLHHGFHDNLYVLLNGAKRFLLFPPSAHPYLHTRGEVDTLYENGLIVYNDNEEEDEDDLEDEEDNMQDTARAFERLQKRLASLNPSPTVIRPDGLPHIQAALWRLRSRLRTLRHAEEQAAKSAGEATKSREERKGKKKMTRDMEEALVAYEQAKTEYRKEVVREELKALGESYSDGESFDSEEDFDLSDDDVLESEEVDSVGEDDWSINSDLVGFGNTDDSESGDPPRESAAERKKENKKNNKKKKSQPGNSSRVQIEEAAQEEEEESDEDIEEDELAGLLEDATTPLDVNGLRHSNGGPGGDSAEEDDEEAPPRADPGLGRVTTEITLSKGDVDSESTSASEEADKKEGESIESDGFVTREQLRDLQKRFGNPDQGTVDEASTDDISDEDGPAETLFYWGKVRDSKALRMILKQDTHGDALKDIPDEDLSTLVYFTPMHWPERYLKEDIADKLNRVWGLLAEYDTRSGEESGSQGSGEDEEHADSQRDGDGGWRMFDEIERERQMEEDLARKAEDDSEDEGDSDQSQEEDVSDSVDIGSDEGGLFEADTQDSADEGEEDSAEEAGPTFDDAASMGSEDFGNIEEGEAAFAKLLADAQSEANGQQQPAPAEEPRSFSLIKPADLHRHFGIGQSGKQAGKLKEKGKALGKFDSESQEARVPLKGCPQPIEVHLKAGQMLYLPASWFHEVTSFSGPSVAVNGHAEGKNDTRNSDTQFHMALNYWFHPPTQLKPPAEAADKTGSSRSNAGPADTTGTADRPYADADVWDEIAIAVQEQVDVAVEAARAHSQITMQNGSKDKKSEEHKAARGKKRRGHKKRKAET